MMKLTTVTGPSTLVTSVSGSVNTLPLTATSSFVAFVLLAAVKLSSAAATLIVTVSLSVALPSLVSTVKVALPLKLLVGVYVTPPVAANVALIAAGVPTKVTTVVPFPVMFDAVRPSVTLLSSVKLPWVWVKVTVTLAVSISVTCKPVMAIAVSSVPANGLVVVLTGASLTAVTVMLTLWLLKTLSLGAVFEPLSITSNVTSSVPLALAVVLYLSPANSSAVTLSFTATAVVPSALNKLMKLGMFVIL